MELTRRQMLRASLGALAATSCGYAVATPTSAAPKTKLQLHAVHIEVPQFVRFAECTLCGKRRAMHELHAIQPVGWKRDAVDKLPSGPVTAELGELRLLVRSSTCRGCIEQPDINKALEAYATPSCYWLIDRQFPGTKTLRLHPDEVTPLFDPLTQLRQWRWQGTSDMFWQLWQGNKYMLQRMSQEMMQAVMCTRPLLLQKPVRLFYKRVPILDNKSANVA